MNSDATLNERLSEDTAAAALQASRLRSMHAAADAARVHTLAHFRTRLSVENKQSDGFDPVTAADRAAERAIREVLLRAFPGYGFLGEESGERSTGGDTRWVVDPIDGTRAYITGAPMWGTLLALQERDRVVLGLLDQPVLGERFIGSSDGAFLIDSQGSRRIRTRGTETLDGAILQATTPDMFKTEFERSGFQRVREAVAMTRFGGDCYAYALLAMGFVDLVVEADLEPYDVQAVIAIVESAGGVCTDWYGGSALDGGTLVAAATPALHRAALARLAPASRA